MPVADDPPPAGERIPASRDVLFHMIRTPPDMIPALLLFVPFICCMLSSVFSLTEKSQFSVINMHRFEMRVMPEKVNMGLLAIPQVLELWEVMAL